MIPNEREIRAIVHGVWSTQLGLEIADVPISSEPPRAPTITAAIHIDGDFRGGIRFCSSQTIARRAGAVMFNVAEDHVTEDDERDVVGELTNVIAGNIKALMRGSNSISLPTIVEGSDYKVSAIDIKSTKNFVFVLDGEFMTVTVFEHGS